MKTIELNLKQSCKLLWSFLWRSWVLMIPVMLISWLCMFLFLFKGFHFPQPGQPPQPPDIKAFPVMFLIWAFMMIVGVTLQALAMKWALNAKWSDFKILVVSKKESEVQDPSTHTT